MPDVQLVDLGMDEDGEATDQHCTGTSLLQLPPPGVPPLILRGISRVLSQHQDVLRLDADAFLLRSPFGLVQDTYPEAHIISSADCAWGRGTSSYCDWYREPSYLDAHSGGDPLADRGFMLNTGLMYVRSTPVTIRVAELAEQTLPSVTSNEQIAFNEALLQYSCRWTRGDGQPIPEEPDKAVNVLREGPIFGSCAEGLRVVVLPWYVVTRAVTNFTGMLGFHPGGTMSNKLSTLPEVEAFCSG